MMVKNIRPWRQRSDRSLNDIFCILEAARFDICREMDDEILVLISDCKQASVVFVDF